MRGWLVPHAPILLPGVNDSEETRALERVRARLREVEPGRAVVLVSPHGPRPGVYRTNRGSLAPFGLDLAVDRGLGQRAEELAAAWGVDLLNEPLDHGAVVPLALCDLGPFVTCLSLPEPNPAAAKALAAVFGDDVTVIASANGAACLTPRAPLTEVEGATAAEERFLDTLAVDAARLSDAVAALPGSCASGPISVLAELFAGTKGEVLAHEAPVGVGYTVTRFER